MNTSILPAGNSSDGSRFAVAGIPQTPGSPVPSDAAWAAALPLVDASNEAMLDVLSTWLDHPVKPGQRRLSDVRREIAAGTYITDEKLDYVVDAILCELTDGKHTPARHRAAG